MHFNQISVTLAAVIIVGPTHFGRGLVAAKTPAECADDMMRTSLKLLDAFKASNRKEFRELCLVYNTVIEDCLVHMNPNEVQASKQAYYLTCGNPEIKSWMGVSDQADDQAVIVTERTSSTQRSKRLRSSGSTIRAGVFSILILVFSLAIYT